MAKESDVPRPQGGVHVEVSARAQYGAGSDVSGVTIKSLNALILTGQTDVVNQLFEIRRRCFAIRRRMDRSETSCVFNTDSININKTTIESIQNSIHSMITQSVKHRQSTQKDTREKLFSKKKRHGKMKP